VTTVTSISGLPLAGALSFLLFPLFVIHIKAHHRKILPSVMRNPLTRSD
jgi:hypothetical protein